MSREATWNYESVKEYIENNTVFILLDNEYINQNTPLKVKCKCEHVSEISFKNIRRTPDKCENCGKGRKITFSYEEVKKFVEDNSDCKLLSTEYKNNSTLLEFECGCGETFTSRFDVFKYSNKRHCKKCSTIIRSEKKKIPYNIVKETIEKDSKRILLNKEYTGTYQKLEILCECGKTFKTNFSEFRAGKTTCSDCTKERMRNYFNFTIQDVEKYVNENSNCKLLSTEYINSLSKLNFLCHCGNEFEQTFATFKRRDKQCQICAQEKRNKSKSFSYEYVKDYVESNTDCRVIAKSYKNSNSKIKLECSCGKHFLTTLNQIRGGKTKCNECSMVEKGLNHRLQYDEIKKFVEENSECELLSKEYLTIKENLIFRCSCGEIFETTFDSFKAGNVRRCKKCVSRISNNEKRVIDFLESNNIDFKFQYTFDDCKNIKCLPFDFGILDSNNNLQKIIEIQGEQHFFPVKFAGITEERAKNNFEKQKYRDNIKFEYCKNNNIELLKIPYTQFKDMEKILKKELNL